MFKTKTMRRQFAALLWGILILAAAGNAAGSGAWWQLCDSCTDDSHFRYQALKAPGHYTPVYVTNRDTNETRKYNRWTSTEDFDGALIQQTEVVAAEFPAAEKAVFEQAVEDSNIVFAQIPRNDLSGLIPGIVDQCSTVGDIQDGFLRSGYLNALRLEIERRNLAPTHESVNVEAGLSTPIAGANYGQGSTIRKRDLVLVIVYEDGSTISLTRRPDGSLISIEILDAKGNVIPVEGAADDGTVPITPTEFGGLDFRFGGGSGNRTAVEALADAINQGSGGLITCTVTSTPTGIRLTCPRQQ